MTRHPNLDTLENLYLGDRTQFFEKLHPNYVCHTPGASPIAGRFVGADGMRAHGAQMRGLTGGTFKARLRAPILIDDTHAMAPTEITATRDDGRTLRMDAFGLYRFEGDRIMDHWEVPLDMAAFDAFWSPAADASEFSGGMENADAGRRMERAWDGRTA